MFKMRAAAYSKWQRPKLLYLLRSSEQLSHFVRLGIGEAHELHIGMLQKHKFAHISETTTFEQFDAFKNGQTVIRD